MEFFYFDTSGLNHLFDDCHNITSRLLETNSKIFISVFTVAEIASTYDISRRNSLLQLAKNVSRNYRPLASPAELLKRSIESIKVRAPYMHSSMSRKWDGVWAILNNPSLIDDKVFQEIKEWKQQQEQWFNDMHARGRPHLQNALESISDSIKFSSFSQLLRYHSPDKQSTKEFVLDIASHASPNAKVDFDLVDRMLNYSEHWRFFLSSMVYSLYVRSVQNTHYSRSQNPGSIDTQQAIYLASCDVFVTADSGQRNMLRLLVPLGHKNRQVWTYKKFANWIQSETEFSR